MDSTRVFAGLLFLARSVPPVILVLWESQKKRWISFFVLAEIMLYSSMREAGKNVDLNRCIIPFVAVCLFREYPFLCCSIECKNMIGMTFPVDAVSHVRDESGNAYK